MKGTTYLPNDSIELSAIKKNYNGAQNKHFEIKSSRIKDLPIFLTMHNYSFIFWNGGIRNEANFLKALGFTGDNDQPKLPIPEAHDRLIKLGINHIIIPSKSHTAHHHRYHIIIFFDVPVFSAKTYKKIAEEIVRELLPESDPSVTDAARYIYGSPDNIDAVSYLEGENYKISNEDGLWDSSLEIEDNTGALKVAHEFEGKTPIFCPFHEDSNPSAFIDYSEKSNNWFIRCSACDQTYWMLKEQSHLERTCENYYSYGTDVYDFGMMNDEFFYEKVGKAKFHVLTGTEHEPDKGEAFRHLVKRHHIRHLSRIDYISNLETDGSYYEVDLDLGVITAHHCAIPVQIEDNQFIEGYLEDRFGEYLTFIKEWIAVYCYTNYKKLPTLIFASDRGNGKSSFVEVIAEIFPTLSFQWGGNEDSFTYEVEKKLLIVDENQSDKVSQYKTLKKYTGQKYATVKKKFKDPYQVKNNTNIIIMSNDAIPLFVSRMELPRDTKNNQFFVYEFPAITGPLDPEMQEKILARLGHYIRTELKIIFDGINVSGYRYSIDVPITPREKELFAANTTDLESDIDIIIDKLISQYGSDTFPKDLPYHGFVDDGYLPIQWIKNYTSGTKHFNQVIKGLIRQRLILSASVKPQKDGVRITCKSMTPKLTSMLSENEAKEEAEVSSVSERMSGDLF